MSAKPQKGGVRDWNALREATALGYADGLTILATIETIEHSNVPQIMDSINQAKAGLSARLLRDSAFFRVQMIVVRAFAPISHKDDLHLRSVIEFLREPGRLEEETWTERRLNLAEAIRLFDDAEPDYRLKALRYMRNKQLAHLARYDETNERPRISELFEFAKITTAIWERLSFGAGTVMIEIDHQLDPYRQSAKAFWGRWASDD